MPYPMGSEFDDVGFTVKVDADVVAFDKHPRNRGGRRRETAPFIQCLLFGGRRSPVSSGCSESKQERGQHRRADKFCDVSHAHSWERGNKAHVVFKRTKCPSLTRVITQSRSDLSEGSLKPAWRKAATTVCDTPPQRVCRLQNRRRFSLSRRPTRPCGRCGRRCCRDGQRWRRGGRGPG